jgi:hypothetical protein
METAVASCVATMETAEGGCVAREVAAETGRVADAGTGVAELEPVLLSREPIRLGMLSSSTTCGATPESRFCCWAIDEYSLFMTLLHL